AGPTDPVFGQVFVDGCTPGDGACAAVTAQVGYGPTGLDPTVDPAPFTWVAATNNPAHTGDDNDEYQAKLGVDEHGSYGYAYRFSLDGGASWSYCDLDGSANGVQIAQLGQLTVAKPQKGVDWCALQWPPSTAAKVGQATEPLFGQV